MSEQSQKRRPSLPYTSEYSRKVRDKHGARCRAWASSEGDEPCDSLATRESHHPLRTTIAFCDEHGEGWSDLRPIEAPRPPKPERKGITPRKRFTILQRDGFRCQLCGRTAEHDLVALEVDHQQPVSKGGTNDDENLWTLCRDCNQGKSDAL